MKFLKNGNTYMETNQNDKINGHAFATIYEKNVFNLYFLYRKKKIK